MYLQTLLGDRSKPFTEKDLTDRELDVIGESIRAARKDREEVLADMARSPIAGKSKEYIRDKGQIEKGAGNVFYSDYVRASISGSDPYSEDDKKYYPIWNALGRFSYDKDPSGDARVKDIYDFYNEQRAPYVREYEKMGEAKKALAMIPAALESIEKLNLKPLASEVGMAYIGRNGRPVDIKIPKDAVYGPKTKSKK
jgi:hypothetical protein